MTETADNRSPGPVRSDDRSRSLVVTWIDRALDFGHFLAAREQLPQTRDVRPSGTTTGWFLELVEADTLPTPAGDQRGRSGESFLAWLIGRETLPQQPDDSASSTGVGWLSWLLGGDQLPATPPPIEGGRKGEVRGR